MAGRAALRSCVVLCAALSAADAAAPSRLRVRPHKASKSHSGKAGKASEAFSGKAGKGKMSKGNTGKSKTGKSKGKTGKSEAYASEAHASKAHAGKAGGDPDASRSNDLAMPDKAGAGIADRATPSPTISPTLNPTLNPTLFPTRADSTGGPTGAQAPRGGGTEFPTPYSEEDVALRGFPDEGDAEDDPDEDGDAYGSIATAIADLTDTGLLDPDVSSRDDARSEPIFVDQRLPSGARDSPSGARDSRPALLLALCGTVAYYVWC